MADSSLPVEGRSAAWRYYVCGLLLLATTINYLDRQTLSAASTRIVEEMQLSKTEYGHLELAFGWAFAVGAATFGWLADRISVRLLYPAVLAAWSLMGYCTGWVESYPAMLVCRTLLGFFEAGHWPCALKTTQRIMSPRERTLGNSILQSGSSIGAIVTPLLAIAMLTPEPGSWRRMFQVIGLAGLGWVALWFASLRRRDFEHAPMPAAAPTNNAERRGPTSAFADIVFSRRFLTLVIVVISINACWHIFRAWLPMFLEKGRGYSSREALGFNSAFYVATDVGCILAGAATVWLARRGLAVHRARVVVFTACALCTSAGIAIHWLPAGWGLSAVLLLVGCGSLGLFPCYYTFSQELSVEHQGKVTGLLGAIAWGTTSPLHSFFGWIIDTTGSYDGGMIAAGACPLIGAAALCLLWDSPTSPTAPTAVAAETPSSA